MIGPIELSRLNGMTTAACPVCDKPISSLTSSLERHITYAHSMAELTERVTQLSAAFKRADDAARGAVKAISALLTAWDEVQG